MDSRDLQLRHTKSHTLEEYRRLMEPLYQAYEETIRRGIAGLTTYAAGLAAAHQEGKIPELRQLVTFMAEFWLDESMEQDSNLAIREKYVGPFDLAVSQARASGTAPALSDQAKQDIVAGLKRHAQEMTDSGGLERVVAQCGALSERLQAEWRGELPRQEMTGGMTLG